MAIRGAPDFFKRQPLDHCPFLFFKGGEERITVFKKHPPLKEKNSAPLHQRERICRWCRCRREVSSTFPLETFAPTSGRTTPPRNEYLIGESYKGYRFAQHLVILWLSKWMVMVVQVSLDQGFTLWIPSFDHMLDPEVNGVRILCTNPCNSSSFRNREVKGSYSFFLPQPSPFLISFNCRGVKEV